MAATGIEVIVQTAAPVVRPRGLFIHAAERLDVQSFQPVKEDGSPGPDRIGLGVAHVPWGCGTVYAGPSNCVVDMVDGILVDPTDGTDLGPNDTKLDAVINCDADVIHPAFKIVTAGRSALRVFPNDTTPSTAIGNRLRNRLAVQSSAALTAELVTGFASGGDSFISETTVQAVSATLSQVGDALEGWLASVLHGAVGFVLLPPQLLHRAIEAGWVRLEAGKFLTATGHQVAADAGYLGDPTDPTDPAPTAFTVFAAAIPAFRVTDGIMLGERDEGIDISTNLTERIAEARAQVVFDPCSVGSTVLTFP